MMLMMTYDSGFRVGELVSLRKKDIDIERKVIIVQHYRTVHQNCQHKKRGNPGIDRFARSRI